MFLLITKWQLQPTYSKAVQKIIPEPTDSKDKIFSSKICDFFFAAFLEQSSKDNRKNVNLYTLYAERNLNGIEQTFNGTFVG